MPQENFSADELAKYRRDGYVSSVRARKGEGSKGSLYGDDNSAFDAEEEAAFGVAAAGAAAGVVGGGVVAGVAAGGVAAGAADAGQVRVPGAANGAAGAGAGVVGAGADGVAVVADAGQVRVPTKKDDARGRAAYRPERTSSEDDSERSRTPAKAHKLSVGTILKRILATVLIIGALLAVAAGTLAVWNQWGRYDDAKSIQGTWQPAGATSTVVINDTTIRLDNNTSFTYSLDTMSKTITYSFGDTQGKGHYRFSLNRNVLSIDTSETTNWFESFTKDTAWTIEALLASKDTSQSALSPATSNSALVLSRVS